MTYTVWLERQQQKVIDYLLEEIRILRDRLGPKPLRLSRSHRVRLAIKGHRLGRSVLTDVATVAKADTILRWYRKLVLPGDASSRKRAPGRPKIDVEVENLVVRMAQENSGWGYKRIKGNLAVIGIKIGRNTVARILARRGIPPAPKRRLPWDVFWAAHWNVLSSAESMGERGSADAKAQADAQRYGP